MPSSRGSSWPRDQTCVSYVSCVGRWVLYHWGMTLRLGIKGISGTSPVLLLSVLAGRWLKTDWCVFPARWPDCVSLIPSLSLKFNNFNQERLSGDLCTHFPGTQCSLKSPFYFQKCFLNYNFSFSSFLTLVLLFFRHTGCKYLGSFWLPSCSQILLNGLFTSISSRVLPSRSRPPPALLSLWRRLFSVLLPTCPL